MADPDHDSHTDQPQDAAESIVPLVHIVLPITGAVLIFLLAFIAVTVA